MKEETLDNLKSWLLKDVKLYPIYTEFKRRILDPIAAEFKAIGYEATWQPMRTGKKTTSLRFSFPRNRQKTPNPKPRGSNTELSSLIKPALSDGHERFYQKLSDTYGLAPWQVQVVTFYLQEGNDEKVKLTRFDNVTGFLNGLNQARAKTELGGYIWQCLKDKYPFMKTTHKILYPNT